MEPNGITCIIPIKAVTYEADREFADYLVALSHAHDVEVIVVDASPEDIFALHDRVWNGRIRHVRPAADLITPMGKVGNVLTGVRLASHDRIIIADDDVRYDAIGLERVARALDTMDVVRPQNYFDPRPWHAYWDSGRMLLNRISGGDWPGTLGVRRAALLATNGYDGAVMFENLELVRTVRAAGGRESTLYDVFVLRRPSTTRHFWSQRVRQAYDELARPHRLVAQLAVLPLVIAALLTGHVLWFAFGLLLTVVLAECGRQREGASRVFPFACSLFAPAWVMERAVCSWLAVASHVLHGGIRYHGAVLRRAATPMRALRERHAHAYRPEAPRRTSPRRLA